MFILAKSFTNKKGEMFLKIFPKQYPSIETAHAVDETDKNVRVVVAAPYDLVEVEDDKEHHASKRKAKRSKDVPVAESKKNDSNEQLSLF